LTDNENTPTEAASSEGDELSRAVQALTQATQLLAATANQIRPATASVPQTMRGTAQPAAGPEIDICPEDPYSEAVPTPNPVEAPTITVGVPVNNFPLLQTTIRDPQPPPARYPRHTAEFRYWQAAWELTLGVNTWAPWCPVGTRWSTFMDPMDVTLDEGVDLNANYTRFFGLRFYHKTVQNVTIFSAQSANVGWHELGHGILDAVKPDTFDTPFIEVAALHESFGDMSSFLSGLQVPLLRQMVLSETGGQIGANSRLSRLAEQLGWGIRQECPTCVDSDSLRNAHNRFVYQPPEQLPPSGPASQLTRRPHNFSRVFTGAFLDALSRMLPAATDANLLTASHQMGQLLIDGVRTANVVPRFYSEVAAAMIQAASARRLLRARRALRFAFVRRGILSPSAAAGLEDAPVPELKPVPVPADDMVLTAGVAGHSGGANGRQTLLTYDDGGDEDGYRRSAADAPEPPTRTITTELGATLLVRIPAVREHFSVAPTALGGGSAESIAPEDDASRFVDDLIQAGAVDLSSAEDIAPQLALLNEDEERTSRQTHEVVDTPEGPLLRRRAFSCSFHCHH
jgi:hypothetical protein